MCAIPCGASSRCTVRLTWRFCSVCRSLRPGRAARRRQPARALLLRCALLRSLAWLTRPLDGRVARLARARSVAIGREWRLATQTASIRWRICRPTLCVLVAGFVNGWPVGNVQRDVPRLSLPYFNVMRASFFKSSLG